MTPQNLRTISRWLRRLANESPDVHPRVACDLANWLAEQADQMDAPAAPPAARPTLTDAEREVLREERDDLEAGGFAAHAAVIDGLLARASKEGR